MAYVSRLTNGTSYNLAGIDASTNNFYEQDPYFNFQLPSNAINLRVTLVDDIQQSFYGNGGWLLVQRGQQPSSNNDLTPTDIIWTDGSLTSGSQPGGYQLPAAEGTYVLTVPSANVLAGEWFVTMDFSSVMQGGTVLVQWDYNDTVPPTLTNLSMDTSSATSLTNGVLNDGADFFFTLPASPAANGEGVSYWTVQVPYNYTVTVVLDDNGNGDLQASIDAGTKYYELALTLSGNAFTGSTTNVDSTVPGNVGKAYQKAPFAVSYTSQVVGGETVYVNVASRSSVPVQGLRMLVNCVPGTQLLPNSDYEPGTTPIVVGGSWVVNYTALSSIAGFGSTLTTATDMLTAFTASEGNYPAAYLADFPLDATLVANNGGDALAAFTCTDSTVAKSFDVDVDGLAGTIYTRLGFYPGSQLITVSDWDTAGLERSSFEQPAQSPFLYVHEMISSPWSRTATTTPATWDTATLSSQLAICLAWDGRVDGSSQPLRPGTSSPYINSGIQLSLYSANTDGSLGTLLHQVTWNATAVPYANSGQGAVVVQYGSSITVDSSGVVISGNGTTATADALLATITTLEAGASFTGATVVAPAGWFNNVPTFFVDSGAGSVMLTSGNRYYVEAKVVSIA